MFALVFCVEGRSSRLGIRDGAGIQHIAPRLGQLARQCCHSCDCSVAECIVAVPVIIRYRIHAIEGIEVERAHQMDVHGQLAATGLRLGVGGV